MKIKTDWEKVLDIPYYTEGPVLDGDDNLYFTTLTGGIIMKLDRRSDLSEWARIQCPNGQRIMENGHHLVCDTGDQSIVELDEDGKVMGCVVKSECVNRTFTSPNDLAIDHEGGFYFTDSIRHRGQVFYVGREVGEKLVASDLDYPNGIALSDDSKRLFVAESYANRILALQLEEPGVAKNKPEVFADLPTNPLPMDPAAMAYTAHLPDGIALDGEGRLWVAHYGMGVLQVLDEVGNHLTSVPTGIPATSNLVFTRDYKTIYVTGGSGEPGPGMIHRIIIEP